MTIKEAIKLMRQMADALERFSNRKDADKVQRRQTAHIAPSIGNMPRLFGYLESNYPNMVGPIRIYDKKLQPCSKKIDRLISSGEIELATKEIRTFNHYCYQLSIQLRDRADELEAEEPPETDAQKGKFGFHKK